MSDTPAANTPPAEDTAAETPSSEPRKAKSSRVGRIIIGLLLVVLAIEGFAHVRATWAKSKLLDELAKADSEEYEVTRAQVKEILGGREPDLSKEVEVDVGEELYDVYYYNGLLKRRVLCVHFGVTGKKDADASEREMMEVMTVVPEEVLFED